MHSAKRMLACICVLALMCAGLLSGCSTGEPVNPAPANNATEDAPLLSGEDLKIEGDTLLAFSANTASALASTQDEAHADENICFSPLSLYLATSLAALGSDNEARAELIELLGIDDLDALAEFCHVIMQTDTTSTDATTIAFANSLWIDDEYAFRAPYAAMVENALDASLFSVDFAAPDTNSQIDAWINDETRGLIEHGIETNSDTIAALINTLYFKDRWTEPFNEENRTTQEFKGERDTTEMTFVNGTIEGSSYIDEPTFTAASLELESGARMTFFLNKDDEAGPLGLMADPSELLALLNTPLQPRSVTWTMPEFVSESSLGSLEKTLQALGVKAPFDPERPGSFTSMIESDSEDFCIDRIAQNNKVSVNASGVEAASATIVEMVKLTSLVDEEDPITFTLDKPFLYAIASAEGHLLFIGTFVNA